MSLTNDEIINQIKGWTPPVFHQKSECYVSFTAFCPATGKMKQKKIMLGRLHGKRYQKLRATQIIQKLTKKLLDGWNPWIEQMRPMEYSTFSDVIEKYKEYLTKEMQCHDLREDTVVSYMSYLRMFSRWGKDKIIYIYQFDRHIASQFLDYVFIDLNNTPQTRNNYLGWLSSFSHYLLQRAYLTINPVEGISKMRRSRRKNREVIPDPVMANIRNFLSERYPHFLLACQFINYLFVRPKEMSYIKIRDISVKNKTLILYGDHTKNHNDAIVTIPDHVMRYMIDLGIFSNPGSWYLFGKNMRPGITHKDQRQFREFWDLKVRKPLNLPETYKFYSFKDTGITNMIKDNENILTVRDQARHSSIEITNRYTPLDRSIADKDIVGYKGVL